MKILFLESAGWNGAALSQAIAALNWPSPLTIQIASPAAIAANALDTYDVVFLPLETATKIVAVAPPALGEKTPYWVVLADDDALDSLVSEMPPDGWDYLTQDTVAQHHLPLALTRILNAAQREQQLQALASENHLLKIASNLVPNQMFMQDPEGRYCLVNREAKAHNATPEALPLGFTGVSVDISDRRRLEAEPTHPPSFLARQQEILELIALGTPLPEVLDRLIKNLESQAEGMVGSVLLLHDHRLWHGAAPSLPDQYQQAINGMAIGPQEGSCGTTAHRKEPTIVTDIATDPLWENYRHLALPHGLRACWSVPIVSRTGRVLGTFAQYYQTPCAPSAQDWGLINAAVKLASLAIEQQRSDEALRESEARFRAIFEQATVGICQVALEGRFLRVNQQFCRFLGYTRKELLTHTFQEVTYPDDLGTSLKGYRHLLMQKFSTFTLEQRYIRKDRTVVWGSVSATLMQDGSQSNPCFIAVVEDITARKQAEMALQNLVEGAAAVTGQDFFPALAAYLATALQIRYVIISKQLGETYTSHAFWADGHIRPKISGRLANTPCGVAIREGFFACSQHLQQQFPDYGLLKELEAEAYIGVRLTNSTGDSIGSLCILDDKPIEHLQRASNILRVFAARVSAELDRQAATDALQQFNQTLESQVEARTAELQQTNGQLQQSLAERQLLVALVENSTSFIITATPAGQITYLNRAGRQLVGLAETTDISRYTVADFHFPADWPKLAKTVLPPLRRGGTWQGEVNLRHFQTGAALPMTHNAFAINHAQTGEPIAFAGILRDITDLKQKEAQLEQLSQRLTLAVQSGRFGIWEYGTDQNRLLWDDRMCELYGIAPADFRGTLADWEQRVHPEDLAQAQAVSDRAVRGECLYDTEFRVVHPNGDIRHLKAYAFYERNDTGEVTRAIGVNFDITDRKRAEAALRESESRYRRLMDGASDAIIMASSDGRVVDVNQKALTLLGYSYDELLGMHVFQLHPPELLEQDRANFTDLITHEHSPPMLTQVLRKDGQRRPVEITAAIIEINGQPMAQSIFRDISDRQQAEREMQQLRERLQFLLSASPAIIYTCEPSGQFSCTYISENVERILGYTPAEWLAQPGFWASCLHPNDAERVLKGLETLFSIGTHAHEYRLRHKAGHYYWVHDELRLIRDPQGNPVEIVGYVADVSGRKQAELALQQLNEDLESVVHQRTTELRDQANLLETILNSMGDGVLVANQAGEIILYNPAGQQITQIEQLPHANPVVWQSHWGIFLPDNQPCPLDQIPLWRALQGEAFDRTEVIVRHQHCPEGRYLEVSGRPLKDEAQQLIGGLAVFRDVSDRKRSEDQLRYNSLHDSLTDLPNRYFLTQHLDQMIVQGHHAEQAGFAVLYLDLDHFKVINDSLGHAIGDQVLVQIARQLEALLPPAGLAARLGGDEFVVVLPPVTEAQSPTAIAQQILQMFQQPLAIGEREIFVKTSIGLVVGLTPYQTAAEILRDADIALYQAKGQGRNQYALFNEAMHIHALERLQLEHDLRNALVNEELVVYYQPIIDIQRHCVSGFEALVRWQHPTRGFVTPDKFIPLAEETGLIAPLDRWVLQTACRQLVAWQQQFPDYGDLTISTNLVVTDLIYPDLLSSIDRILIDTGLDGRHLILEITESMLIEQLQPMAQVLEKLQSRGIRISIDDFGTGYSSLSYLHQLPVNAFKIDRSFVTQMESSDKNAEIVKTIITLSKRLGLKIIAEGVETDAQLQYLKALNCDRAQGYLFAPPLPAAAAADFLTHFRDRFVN